MHVSNVLKFEINGVKTEESILLKAKLFIQSKHSKLSYTWPSPRVFWGISLKNEARST